jgi:hypothetical protein
VLVGKTAVERRATNVSRDSLVVTRIDLPRSMYGKK